MKIFAIFEKIARYNIKYEDILGRKIFDAIRNLVQREKHCEFHNCERNEAEKMYCSFNSFRYEDGNQRYYMSSLRNFVYLCPSFCS